jgi:hypothetical protein
VYSQFCRRNPKPILFSGASGLAFIEQALNLSLPPKIIAYARSPDKIPDDLQSRIQTVKGSLDDHDALLEALTDADAVVSFLVREIPRCSIYMWLILLSICRESIRL